MSESEISQKLCNALKQQGAVIFKIHGHAMQQPGIPDFYLSHPLWQGWIETKGPMTKLTNLQATIIRKLRRTGSNVCVLRFMDSKRWRIEDEDNGIVKYFEHSGWNDGATMLLRILNGYRAHTELSPNTQ